MSGIQVVTPSAFTGSSANALPTILPASPVGGIANRWIFGASGLEPGASLAGVADRLNGTTLGGHSTVPLPSLAVQAGWGLPVGDFATKALATAGGTINTTTGATVVIAFQLKAKPTSFSCILQVTGAKGASVYADATKIYMYESEGSSTILPAVDLAPHVLALTFDGTTLRPYLDGKPIAQTIPKTGAAGLNLILGAFNGGYGSNLVIADATVASRAFTAPEVASYSKFLAGMHGVAI